MTSASSPCTGVCTMDASGGHCLGCGRTLDEIVGWSGYSEPRRLAVMAGLPERLHGGKSEKADPCWTPGHAPRS